jgi:hypothetical protein
VEQKRADATFPLAALADCDGLAELAQRTGAPLVIATRGDATAFASVLRRRGIEAGAIDLPPIDDRGAS